MHTCTLSHELRVELFLTMYSRKSVTSLNKVSHPKLLFSLWVRAGETSCSYFPRRSLFWIGDKRGLSSLVLYSLVTLNHIDSSVICLFNCTHRFCFALSRCSQVFLWRPFAMALLLGGRKHCQSQCTSWSAFHSRIYVYVLARLRSNNANPNYIPRPHF